MRPKEYFGEIAAAYKTFRPTYPAALFEYLATIAPGHERAWDCATGNGQAARSLKPFFRQVIASDASEKQIREAERTEGIEYVVATAERTTIDPGSVDLVTVAQALHWFDLPKFYAEVSRVAKPRGVLACWCYALMNTNADIDPLIWTLYHDILDDYWPSERRLIEKRYSTIDFPFDELQPPALQMTQPWNLGQMLGYLRTWSAAAAYKKKTGNDPVALIEDQLHARWGDPEKMQTVVWPLHLRVGRLPNRP